MTKYNNYAGVGTGNGKNKIAILDPNATEPDPVFPSTLVMNEVFTIKGVTPDPNFPNFPGAVREWCINTAAVDPITKSVIVNSEDGKLYRWDLKTNTLSQIITLSSGVGEAYTPTAIAPMAPRSPSMTPCCSPSAAKRPRSVTAARLQSSAWPWT
jgi:hypothetical protein